MICPKCGVNNPDHAMQCDACYYKFNFGHGYKDPGNAPFFAAGSGRKAKIAQRLFGGIFIFIILVTIVSWIISRYFF